jgi:membrane associated rhomboid family serine protease
MTVSPAQATIGAMADEAVGVSGREAGKAALAAFQLHLRQVTPRLRVVPVLVALNVVVFGAMTALGASVVAPTGDEALRFGADYGPLTLGGQPWRLLTNVFVHFGAIHLLANMAALLSVGPTVERLYGPSAFAAIYLAGGIAGSLLSVGAHPVVVSAGASGAIFGVYGGLAAFVLRQRSAIPPLVVSRLASVAGTFIVYNVLYGAGHAGIDNMAHVGGLLGGVAAAAILVRPLAPARPNNPYQPGLVVLAAVVLAITVAVALPTPVAFDTMQRTYDSGEAILDHYNEMINRLNAGKIGPREFGVDLDHTTRPALHTLIAKLRSQRQVWQRQKVSTPRERDYLDLVDRLLVVREDGLARMSAAVAADDAAAFGRISEEMEAAADEVGKRLELMDQAEQANSE